MTRQRSAAAIDRVRERDRSYFGKSTAPRKTRRSIRFQRRTNALVLTEGSGEHPNKLAQNWAGFTPNMSTAVINRCSGDEVVYNGRFPNDTMGCKHPSRHRYWRQVLQGQTASVSNDLRIK